MLAFVLEGSRPGMAGSSLYSTITKTFIDKQGTLAMIRCSLIQSLEPHGSFINFVERLLYIPYRIGKQFFLNKHIDLELIFSFETNAWEIFLFKVVFL